MTKSTLAHRISFCAYC